MMIWRSLDPKALASLLVSVRDFVAIRQMPPQSGEPMPAPPHPPAARDGAGDRFHADNQS
ncbi:MAG: hypothetical protein U1E38_02830 [Rhodospirillales bacterium]